MMRVHSVGGNNLQRSEWDTAPSSVSNQGKSHTVTINPDDKTENKTINARPGNEQEGILARHPCLVGFTAGASVCGVLLEILLTIWLTSRAVTTPVTTTTTSATTVTTTTSTASSTSSSTISTTSTSTTTTATPCLTNNLQWSSSGITVMSSPTISRLSGLYVDSHDTLYGVDEIYNSIVWKLLNNTSTPILVAGQNDTRGPSPLLLDYPQDVYVDSSGNMYVTDYYNYRVQKYASGSLNRVTIAGLTKDNGTSLNQFAGLRYFAFDSTESLMYITDSENSRVMRYSTNSTYGANGVSVAGGNGAGDTSSQFHYPWGIVYRSSVSPDMYITNNAGHSVIRWTAGAASGDFVVGTRGVAGSTSTTLSGPMGIKMDNYLNMFVVDNGNNRVQMFCYNSPTGITVAGTGAAGATPNLLNGPRGIAFDSVVNMYVSNFNNMRVQKFLKL